MNVIKAFSLIELLVVVAIIAVLAAIAFPIYQQYSIKAKMTATVATLHDMKLQLIKQFESGKNVANGFTYNQYTILANSQTAVSNLPFQNIWYFSPTTNQYVIDAQGIYGLTGEPNYVVGGTYSNLDLRIVYDPTSGVWKEYCGRWTTQSINETTDTDYGDVLPAWLPPGCNCLNVQTGAC